MSTSARWVIKPAPPLARLPWRGGWLALLDREAYYFGEVGSTSLCGTAERTEEHRFGRGQRCAGCLALRTLPESAA